MPPHYGSGCKPLAWYCLLHLFIVCTQLGKKMRVQLDKCVLPGCAQKLADQSGWRLLKLMLLAHAICVWAGLQVSSMVQSAAFAHGVQPNAGCDDALRSVCAARVCWRRYSHRSGGQLLQLLLLAHAIGSWDGTAGLTIYLFVQCLQIKCWVRYCVLL
jgi:hypothetical protein